MPKQYYKITDFSRGINSVKDPRDIAENEVAYSKNISTDAQGKLKSAGGLVSHKTNPNGVNADLTSYVSSHTGKFGDDGVGGGYNLFYFESDHSKKNEFNDAGTTTFTIGDTTDGNISFIDPANTNISSGDTVAPGGSGQGSESTL